VIDKPSEALLLERVCDRCRGYVEQGETPESGWCQECRPLVEGVLALRRIVTVDIDGRTIRFDKLAEAEAALDETERANLRIYERVDALRAGSYGTGDYVMVKRDAYVALMNEAGVNAAPEGRTTS
jgi:hypothetical protein